MHKAALFLGSLALCALLLPRAPLPPHSEARAVAAAEMLHARFFVVTELAQGGLATVALAPSAWLTERCHLVGRARLAVLAIPSLLCTALLSVLLFGSALRRKATAKAAFSYAALVLLSTPLVIYARLPDGTLLATLLLCAAVQWLRRDAMVADVGIALTASLLVLCDPVYLGAAALLVLVRAAQMVRTSWWRALAICLMFAPGLILAWLAHQRAGMGGAPICDLVDGVVGLTLSAGKGIIWYCPILVAALWYWPAWWRTDRRSALLSLAVVTLVLLPLGRQANWHGDPAWGPRRFLPVLPLLCEPLQLGLARLTVATRPARLAFAIVALIGGSVQILGLAFPPTTYLRMVTQMKDRSGAKSWFVAAPSEAHYIAYLSPLRGHFWLLSHFVRRDPRFERDPPWRLIVSPLSKSDWRAVLGEGPQIDWWILGKWAVDRN